MIRGTTPTHIFKTSISLVNATKIAVTYTQGTQKVIVEKKKEDCEITPTQLSVELTQQETFEFKALGYKAEVQITAEFMEGDKPKVLKSNIIEVDVSRSLKREII